MESKKGISLIVLVITLIVLTILASVVIFTSSDTTNMSKKAAFALDLEQLEEAADEYYLTNNNLPVVSEVEYTKAELVGLVDASKRTLLSSEITENNDTNAIFYKLDLSKLPVENSSRGLGTGSDSTDIYVIANDTHNIYYLNGEAIEDTYYFSLTTALTGKTKVVSNSQDDTSNINIVATTNTIKLTKNTEEWTNNLIVKVDTTLNTGETLKYYLGTYDITQNVTSENINIAQLFTANADAMNAFNSSSSNRIIKVQKIKNEQVATQDTIDISNFDILAGNMISQSNVAFTPYTEYVLANITGYEDLGNSGVKEARVIYLTKVDELGNNSPYYENLPSPMTKEYIYSSGKKFDAKVLKLPKNVVSFAIVFVDNAGNVSDFASINVNY